MVTTKVVSPEFQNQFIQVTMMFKLRKEVRARYSITQEIGDDSGASALFPRSSSFKIHESIRKIYHETRSLNFNHFFFFLLLS